MEKMEESWGMGTEKAKRIKYFYSWFLGSGVFSERISNSLVAGNVGPTTLSLFHHGRRKMKNKVNNNKRDIIF